MTEPATRTSGGLVDWPTELARHQRWLRTVLYARVRSAEAVDELLQEVALAAVRQAAPLCDAAKLAPWLYQVAVRQALMYRRRCGRRRRLEQRARTLEPSAPAARGLEPLAWLLARERQALVRRALAELVERDVEVLLLKYTEDWSYREIAEHLGLSASAVEARLHRARQRLRERLAALDLVEAEH